jgi:hypothetical protein
MSIHPQEKTYTEEEVNHLVAREVAKQRMADIERNVANVNDQVVKMWAKFDASFEALNKALENRDGELRREIERDFATKLEMEQLRSELSKVWLKVSIPVATLVIVAELAIKIFIK